MYRLNDDKEKAVTSEVDKNEDKSEINEAGLLRPGRPGRPGQYRATTSNGDVGMPYVYVNASEVDDTVYDDDDDDSEEDSNNDDYDDGGGGRGGGWNIFRQMNY